MNRFVLVLGLIAYYFSTPTTSPKPFITITTTGWGKPRLPFGSEKLRVQIVLANPSADTVKFIAGSCHWGNLLVTNKDSIHLEEYIACNVSNPMLYTIPPYRSMTDSFELGCYKKNGWTAGTTAKVGYRYYDGTGHNEVPRSFTFHKKKHDTLWSESFTIPALPKP